MEEGVQALEVDSGHLDKTFWAWVPRRWPSGGMQALWAHSHGPWPSQPGGRAQLEEGWMGLGIKCALSPCLSAQFGGIKYICISVQLPPPSNTKTFSSSQTGSVSIPQELGMPLPQSPATTIPLPVAANWPVLGPWWKQHLCVWLTSPHLFCPSPRGRCWAERLNHLADWSCFPEEI